MQLLFGEKSKVVVERSELRASGILSDYFTFLRIMNCIRLIKLSDVTSITRAILSKYKPIGILSLSIPYFFFFQSSVFVFIGTRRGMPEKTITPRYFS